MRLYRYGFRDPLAELIRELLSAGDTFVDGGANIGLFTLVAAEAVGAAGRVIACEPSPETAEMLRSNVSLNGFVWVSVHEAALAERPGREAFWSFEPGAGLSSFAPEAVEGAQRREVDVTTLDELVAGAPVRLVKLDLEGAELRALRGARRTLAHVRPDLLLEIEAPHLARQGGTVEALYALLDSAGYSVAEVSSPNVLFKPAERLG
ncbi:MAG: FkbM family methyltransferase [Gaiellaceae bacterium]